MSPTEPSDNMLNHLVHAIDVRAGQRVIVGFDANGRPYARATDSDPYAPAEGIPLTVAVAVRGERSRRGYFHLRLPADVVEVAELQTIGSQPLAKTDDSERFTVTETEAEGLVADMAEDSGTGAGRRAPAGTGDRPGMAGWLLKRGWMRDSHTNTWVAPVNLDDDEDGGRRRFTWLSEATMHQLELEALHAANAHRARARARAEYARAEKAARAEHRDESAIPADWLLERGWTRDGDTWVAPANQVRDIITGGPRRCASLTEAAIHQREREAARGVHYPPWSKTLPPEPPARTVGELGALLGDEARAAQAGLLDDYLLDWKDALAKYEVSPHAPATEPERLHADVLRPTVDQVRDVIVSKVSAHAGRGAQAIAQAVVDELDERDWLRLMADPGDLHDGRDAYAAWCEVLRSRWLAPTTPASFFGPSSTSQPASEPKAFAFLTDAERFAWHTVAAAYQQETDVGTLIAEGDQQGGPNDEEGPDGSR